MQDLHLWLQKHVSIVYLPSFEFFLSLHVLGSPEHHTSRLDWSKEMLATLPPTFLEELAHFRAMSANFLDIIDPLEPWNESLYSSIEAGLELYETMSTEGFVQAMMGPVYHPKQIHAWMHGRTDEKFEQLKPEHRELIRRPKATKRAFLEFCYQYLPFFQKEQRRIEPWLIRSMHESQEKLRRDPLGFMEEIHPRLHVHDTFLQFHKAKTYTFFYQELNQIYVKPSTFVSPHLLLGIYPEKISVALQVEVPGTNQKAVIPKDFITKLKVFSDPTRVAILKSLIHHPYCIQQLAELHGISEPAVTKHLKLLVEAKFVWSERRGRYVFYKATSDRIEQLAVDLHEFIDMPDPTLLDRRE